MMILTPLFAVALLGQNSSTLIRVAPETLAWLGRGGPAEVRLAEAILGRPATSATIDSKESALLSRKDFRSKSLAEARARATRQLQTGLVTPSSSAVLLTADRKPMVRTTLNKGGVLYDDLKFMTGLLVPVSLDESQLGEKESAVRTLSKLVLARLRIPQEAQWPITGSINRVDLPNDRKVWGGVLEFGHAPDANGIYKISEPKWYDHVSVWTDGEVMWIQYGRDDTVMGAANANPPKPEQ